MRFLKEIVDKAPEGSPVSLAVGPEGGWTADEIKRFADSGWHSASLGPTILRAETAAIAALAVVMAMAGAPPRVRVLAFFLNLLKNKGISDVPASRNRPPNSHAT